MSEYREVIESGGRLGGKTHHMLHRAIRLMREGRKVYVVVHTREFAQELRRRVAELWAAEREENEPTVTSVSVDSVEMTGYDWWVGGTPGAHPNCVFLVDHHAREMRAVELQGKIDDLKRQIDAEVGQIAHLSRFDQCGEWRSDR